MRFVQLTNRNETGGFALMEQAAWRNKCGCSETLLVVAVRHLAREYRNALASLHFSLDSNRDLLLPLPDDHPVALGVFASFTA